MSTLTLLATTSPQERAALFSFGFYLLNLLIPLIPAVIIYRVFPEGKTQGSGGNSVEGSLGGWKIKAVGAWGAYVTAFLLGYWSIKATAIPLINAIGGASVWKVESHFKLVDEHGQEINAAINNLIVEPPLVQPWGRKATITLFSPTLEPPEQLRIKLDGYEDETVDLSGITPQRDKIKVPLITLKRLPPIPQLPAPAPLAPGDGPPALASNP
jgi:hypothetical protein